MTLLVHIVAASLALVFGYVALYEAKGATLHRKSGRLFVRATVIMCFAALMVAAVRDVAPAVNIPAARFGARLDLHGTCGA